jgi:HlyD family secretion protein
MKNIFYTIVIVTLIASCSSNKNKYDASGTFEADETIISAEVSGVIRQLDAEEGQQLKSGQVLGYIDSVQLYLKKKQLTAQIKTAISQRPDIAKQLAVLSQQLITAQKEQARISNLLKAEAATQKQMDDANAQVEILQKQIEAQKSSLNITSESISQQANPLQVQIEQVNDQLERSKIINPVDGTVLNKYAEANEMVTAGKPLYKIADLSTLILRAYITGDQLSSVKISQQVKILVDTADNKSREYSGIIEWISDKAEFTPKTIQTKDERANLVYAMKIRVKNDGYLKIGMYADVKF